MAVGAFCQYRYLEFMLAGVSELINSNQWYSRPFSQLTFWDRKNTAQNVGDGDVYEMLVRRSLLRGAHKGSRLVAIRHSFGGATVISRFRITCLNRSPPTRCPAITSQGDWSI